MIRPMLSALIGIGGIWVIAIGIWAKSLSIATYGGLMAGFAIGTFIGTKDN